MVCTHAAGFPHTAPRCVFISSCHRTFDVHDGALHSFLLFALSGHMIDTLRWKRRVVKGKRSSKAVVRKFFTRTLLLCALCFVSAKITSERRVGGVTSSCTMVLNGFSREHVLTALALHYSAMEVVNKVRVVWGNTKQHPEFFLSHTKSVSRLGDKIEVIMTPTDDLNDRFLPIAPLRESRCVIIADDDIYVDERTVNAAHALWMKHQTQIVGLFPRAHTVTSQGTFYNSNPKYRYSIILTKFMVLDSAYLDAYSNQMPASVRDYVREKGNCEDIAMNYLVTSLSNKSPIYLRDATKIDFGGKTGIYNRPGHINARDECMRQIPELLDSQLLIYNDLAFTANAEERFMGDSFVHGTEFDLKELDFSHIQDSADSIQAVERLRHQLVTIRSKSF